MSLLFPSRWTSPIALTVMLGLGCGGGQSPYAMDPQDMAYIPSQIDFSSDLRGDASDPPDLDVPPDAAGCGTLTYKPGWVGAANGYTHVVGFNGPCCQVTAQSSISVTTLYCNGTTCTCSSSQNGCLQPRSFSQQHYINAACTPATIAAIWHDCSSFEPSNGSCTVFYDDAIMGPPW